MTKLGVSLNKDERELIAEELERLFIMQDRALPALKKGILAEELSLSGYPFKAIIEGIRALKGCDLDKISLAVILKAVSDKIEPRNDSSEAPAGKCEHCGGDGYISLVDVTVEPKTGKPGYPYEYAFCCVCERGKDLYSKGKGMMWNGERTQVWKGRTYREYISWLKGGGGN